jgi:hypothetical protein
VGVMEVEERCGGEEAIVVICDGGWCSAIVIWTHENLLQVLVRVGEENYFIFIVLRFLGHEFCYFYCLKNSYLIHQQVISFKF